MIVTVTANTTLDHILFVPSFAFNKTLRARDVLITIGGKPTDASWILGEMGIPSLALGFAAGHVGQQVEEILQEKGVVTDFIQVDGESRRNILVMSEDGQGEVTITFSSLQVSEAHVDALRDRYVRALSDATCVVIGGTLPHTVSPAFYTEFIRLARERSIPVIFDAGEPNLSAGLVSRPNYVKPNRDELTALMGEPIVSVDDALRAGRSILERFGTIPIVSLGGDGGLAVLPDRTYHIPPLPVNVVSTAGAGDAVLAGLAYAIVRDEPIETALRVGFGAAAAVCTMPGTAQCRRADIEHFTQQVQLIPYTPAREQILDAV